jgi:hypothetical protein
MSPELAQSCRSRRRAIMAAIEGTPDMIIAELAVIPWSSDGQLHPRDWSTVSAWLTSFFVPDWDQLQEQKPLTVQLRNIQLAREGSRM